MSELRRKDQIIGLSLMVSFFISFFICMIPHIDKSKYNFMPDSGNDGYYTGISRVLSASCECGFGERHILNTNNLNVSDLYNTRNSNSVYDTFDHFFLMLIIACLLTIIMSVIWIRTIDKNKFEEIN